MAEQEKELINSRLKLLTPLQRRFRINAGSAWSGEVVKQTDNFIILKNPRRFIGAPTGWPDLCGWDSVKITPEMVGQKISVFVGEEFKTPHVRMSKEQTIFGKLLLRMGGIFKIVRPDDLK